MPQPSAGGPLSGRSLKRRMSRVLTVRRAALSVVAMFLVVMAGGLTSAAEATPTPTLTIDLNANQHVVSPTLYTQSGPIEVSSTLSSALSSTSYIGYFVNLQSDGSCTGTSAPYQEGVGLADNQVQQSVDVADINSGSNLPVGDYYIEAMAYDRTSGAFVATSNCLPFSVRVVGSHLTLPSSTFTTGDPIPATATDLGGTPSDTSYYRFQVFQGGGCSGPLLLGTGGTTMGTFGQSVPNGQNSTTGDLNILILGRTGSYSTNAFLFDRQAGNYVNGSNCVDFSVGPQALTPEVPVSLALPGAALLIFGGTYVVYLRRRHAA